MDTLEYIKQNCVMRREDGIELYGRNGIPFVWALDLRKALLNPAFLKNMAEEFLDTHQKYYPYQIAAVETSGIAMLLAIQLCAAERGLDINGVIVRKKRKKHLQQAHIDGEDKGLPTIVVDDSMNSGSSMFNAVVKLKDAGYKVYRTYTIVSFLSETSIAGANNLGVIMGHKYTISELDLYFQYDHKPKTKYDVVWTFGSPDPNLSFCVAKSKPVLHKQTILFGSDCGTFWCLDKNNGRIKWFFGTKDKTGNGIISSPIIDNGRVYFGAYDGTLYCLDADTGALIWANPCCNWIGSSPLIVRDKLYIGLEFDHETHKGAMAAFDKESGGMLWTIPTEIQLHGSPAYNEKHDAVVWGTNDGTVAVIDIRKEQVIQTLKGIGAVKYPVATEGDLAVFGAFDGNIYVWDFVQDRIMFSYHTDDIVYSTPLIVGNMVFIGSADHQFISINLDDFSLRAAFDMKEKIHSSPSLIDGLVYFGTSKGELIGMYPATLQTAVEYQFPERITNAIVSDGKLLFVYGVDNKMWAIRHG